MNAQLLDAIKNGDVNGVQRLLAAGADPSASNNGAIRTASANGHLEVVRLLLTDPRVNPSAVNNSAVRNASGNGHLEVVRLLLTDPRVNPSAVNNGAVRNASGNGHLEVVRLLLSNPRVDPSAVNNDAIRFAARNGQLEVVRLLLTDPRVNPSDRDNDAIRWAAINNHPEVVWLLATVPGILSATVDYYLERGLWDELQRLARMTGCLSESEEDLMVWGAAIGSIDLVEALIEKGVDPTFEDNLALEAAQRYGRQDVIDYLEMFNVD